MSKNEYKIIKLDNLEQMLEIYEVIKYMYDELSFESYKNQLKDMIEFGNYKMVAIYHNNKPIGTFGYFILSMFYCGKYIQICNLVVLKEYRSLGIGKKLLNYAKNLGKLLKCDKIVLDSYTENKRSHSLYFREGFHIRGFHFMNKLD